MWLIGEIHPMFGEVVACGVTQGEPWRMFLCDGVISMIPLSSC